MNYSEKIQRLRDRRQGLYTKDGRFALDEALGALRKQEKFTSIAQPESVKYAIGAMQRVDDEYTQNSYAEGNRVRDRLAEGLTAANLPATYEYQGSVPLDVHVRGNSDIDLLVLHAGFVTAELEVWQQYGYVKAGSGGKSVTDELAELRKESINVLQRRYYGADIDTSGSKSISLSGGSLKRTVDVVPSHWHDTLAWKQTQDQANRDVYILDSHKGVRIPNKPFMHIRLVQNKCIATGGALRKVIRLLKNVRYDATPAIALPSYDIVALAWNMAEADLIVPFGVDLLLVERARAYLKLVIGNPSYRNALRVPDGSRVIYDKPEKLAATIQLYGEIDQLVKDIYRELDPVATMFNRPASTVLAKAVYI
ncbi:MAG: hypothetical protein CTY39_01445 [Hyphomicrobium sp.]|nr:MAG: hypothetical protein CTY39_01445 [Hyphomicrobium sp.]